jgi:ubiquinone/menaquinone biosynthesis C-methylase UbiE
MLALPMVALGSDDEELDIEALQAQILEILGETPPPKNVVDIGCGTGAMTAALAETWGLGRMDALGIDVFDRSQAADRYTHLTFDGDRIPLDDHSVVLTLIMMVLHHEDEPEGLLREAARILEPGGRLFVRECDSETPSRMLFNDLMDHLYYQVFNDLSVIPNPANHRPTSHWSAAFAATGFDVDLQLYPEPKNPFRPVHFLLTRRSA